MRGWMRRRIALAPFCTENSNKPHGFGVINPVIAKFFREFGRADELGSDVRNMK